MSETENPPLVSVVLPTYNRAGLLPRAMGSVLAQTYRNLELIVADDGSTDETERVVRAVEDQRVRYLRCERNGGPGYARNCGVRIASGAFIAFQDSDDEWLPDKLSRQLELLQAMPDRVGMVCGAYVVRYVGGGELQVVPDLRGEQGDFEPELLAGFRFIPPTWLFRRQCLAAVGPFDERLPNREDWELMFRVLERWEVRALKAPVTIKHETLGSIEGNWQGRVTSYGRILERYSARWGAVPKLKAIHYYEMARAQLALADAAGARHSLGQVLRLDPFRPRIVLMWLALLFGMRAYQWVQGLDARLPRSGQGVERQ